MEEDESFHGSTGLLMPGRGGRRTNERTKSLASWLLLSSRVSFDGSIDGGWKGGEEWRRRRRGERLE